MSFGLRSNIANRPACKQKDPATGGTVAGSSPDLLEQASLIERDKGYTYGEGVELRPISLSE